MRLSRPCYDKYHRCPGWAGPGLRFQREGREFCVGGYIHCHGRAWRWRFHRCGECGVLVLPYMVRWVDPTWLRSYRRAPVRTLGSLAALVALAGFLALLEAATRCPWR